jgi:hypothetical protein
MTWRRRGEAEEKTENQEMGCPEKRHPQRLVDDGLQDWF